MKWKSLSCVRLFATPRIPWNSPGQNTGVGSLSLLQGIFATQGSNPGLPQCRRILHQLSHKGRQPHKQQLPLLWLKCCDTDVCCVYEHREGSTHTSSKPAFSLSSFTFIKRPFSSSSLSAIRVLSSAYLRLLKFLLAVLIPVCDSSSLAFGMMCSIFKLNKQGDDIQPWCAPFPIWNQSFHILQF